MLIGFNRTIPYAGADFSRKLSAGIRAFFINRAEAGLRIKKIAVAIGFLRQHEKLSSLAVRRDEAVFFQAFRELFNGVGGLVLTGYTKSEQVGKLYLNRH